MIAATEPPVGCAGKLRLRCRDWDDADGGVDQIVPQIPRSVFTAAAVNDDRHFEISWQPIEAAPDPLR